MLPSGPFWFSELTYSVLSCCSLLAPEANPQQAVHLRPYPISSDSHTLEGHPPRRLLLAFSWDLSLLILVRSAAPPENISWQWKANSVLLFTGFLPSLSTATIHHIIRLLYVHIVLIVLKLFTLALEMKKFTFREYRRSPNGTSAYLRGIVYKVFSVEWHYNLVVSVPHFYNRGGFHTYNEYVSSFIYL